jgi:hypothetical protein
MRAPRMIGRWVATIAVVTAAIVIWAFLAGRRETGLNLLGAELALASAFLGVTWTRRARTEIVNHGLLAVSFTVAAYLTAREGGGYIVYLFALISVGDVLHRAFGERDQSGSGNNRVKGDTGPKGKAEGAERAGLK